MAPTIGIDAQGRKTYTFPFTGAVETWIAPGGKLLIEVWGAEGEGNGSGSQGRGGKGGYAKGEKDVAANTPLFISAGGRVGGFGGGALYYGPDGGGASDVRTEASSLNSRIIVAGGGGGAGTKYLTTEFGGTPGNGGVGGGLVGGVGTNKTGDGGTQSAGGLPGTGGTLVMGSAGNFGNGGWGGDGRNNTSGSSIGGKGGCGGGGWYGGGGGAGGTYAEVGGGGGGGSSYIGGVTNSVTTAGLRSGDGLVVITVLSNAPTLTLSTTDNRTLYENDTFKIDGSTVDSDIGDVVNVYYRINGGTSRAIATGISTGAALSFNEQLTFKGGILYKDATAITGALTEGTAHRIEVWSEDNQGGKSTVAERTFHVVPNRAPSLTVDAFIGQSGLIRNDKLNVSGTSFDLDGNDVTVRYRINGGSPVQIHSGAAGPWTFDFSLKSLVNGPNAIVVEVIDTHDFKSSRTITLNRTYISATLANGVQRYRITPPTGSAQGIVLWVERGEGQTVAADISATTGSEQEQYSAMTLTNTAPTPSGAIEDEFTFQSDAPKENIILKLKTSGTGSITLITGVLN